MRKAWFNHEHHGRMGHKFGRGMGREGMMGGWRGAGRARRGDIKFLILDVLADAPRHGYDIITALEEKSNGRYRPSPGSVYPTLTMLEEGGSIIGETSDGKTRLHDHRSRSRIARPKAGRCAGERRRRRGSTRLDDESRRRGHASRPCERRRLATQGTRHPRHRTARHLYDPRRERIGTTRREHETRDAMSDAQRVAIEKSGERLTALKVRPLTTLTNSGR